MSPVSMLEFPSQPIDAEQVRFVLKSGAHLDLELDSVEEVTEFIAGIQCMCICANLIAGSKVIVPWQNVDFLTEVD